MTTELLRTAATYHEHGLQVMPLPYGSKRPEASWKDYIYKPNTPEQLLAEFNQQCNIAILGGEISNNFFVLDFDSMGLFHEHRRKIERILNNTAVVKTSRGVHVYLKAPYPVRTSKVGKLDIKGEGGYVIAPPSLHPDGKQYSFWDEFGGVMIVDPESLPFGITPVTPSQTAQNQRREAQNGRVTLYAPDVKPYGLSGNLWAILKAKPDIVNRYESRSEAEMAVVTYCVNNAWAFEEVLALFYMHAAPGTKFHDEKAGNAITARKWLSSLYTGAIEYLTENRREIDATLDRYMRSAVFSGRTRYTDQAVYTAIITIARRCGKLQNIGAARREVAELAGIQHWQTVSKSFHRIPYIEKSGHHNGTTLVNLIDPETTTQKLVISKLRHSFTEGPCGEPLKPLRDKDLNKDVWVFRGAGKSGLSVYNALDDIEGRTARQIAALTGISLPTVWRKLMLFLEIGAARKDESRFFLLNFDREKAAQSLGVAGTGERLKERHRKEREGWNEIKKRRA